MRTSRATRGALIAVPLVIAALALALTVYKGGAGAATAPTTSSSARIGPEGVPIPPGSVLAPPSSPGLGRSIDGVACGPVEQLVFHIHAHLTVFVGGSARVVPLGIGIAPPLRVEPTPAGLYAVGGQCFSYLHTHAADGIIHVESPVERTYTLGEFFDVWNQPLGKGRVGPARGPVTAFVDGRRYLGDPRAIPLLAHAQIQLDVGRPVVAPQSIQFPAGL